MSSTRLTVKEKYSQYWPMITVLSAVMCVLFLISYIIVTDVLIGGYLRLAAFAFFALSLLSLFKLKDGQIEIEFTIDKNEEPKLVQLKYFVRENEIHTESHELNEFTEFKITEVPNKSFYNDLIKGDKAVRFKKKDLDDWMYLNNIYGRIIPLSQGNAEKVTEFIKSEKKVE